MDKMVITGIGMSSHFADSPEELYNVLKESEIMAGEVPMPCLNKKRGLAFTDNITKKLYGVYEKAMADSGLSDDDAAKDYTGIFLGNAQGSLDSIVNFEAKSIVEGYKSVLPASFINTVMNAPAGQLAILAGIKGMNLTFSDGSSASVSALEYSADMLGDKRIRRAVVGAIEDASPLYDSYLKSYDAIPSGGVCLLTTETEKDAQKRGAKIYAAWRGSAGAYYETPETEQIYEVMNRAVADSGLNKEDIDFVITSCGAGKTSTNEVEAVLKFGVPYVDVKKVTGEIYGAFGVFAAVCAISIMRHKMLPDGTPLKRSKYALINSVGFDGYITSFVLEGR